MTDFQATGAKIVDPWTGKLTVDGAGAVRRVRHALEHGTLDARNDWRKAMSFTCAERERYNDALVAMTGQRKALAADYAAQPFKSETARAFATEGFPCRLELMDDCVGHAMEAFPPGIF